MYLHLFPSFFEARDFFLTGATRICKAHCSGEEKYTNIGHFTVQLVLLLAGFSLDNPLNYKVEREPVNFFTELK